MRKYSSIKLIDIPCSIPLLDVSVIFRYNTISTLKRESWVKEMFESKLKSDRVDLLAKAFLALESEEDCYRLFEDLFTIREVQDLSSRMEIAMMLRDKETYNVIVEKTGASTATIGRVNRALNYGADGYARVMDKICKKD